MIPVEKMWKADLQSELREAREELQSFRNASPLITELLKLLDQKWFSILLNLGKIWEIVKALKQTYK